MRYYDSFNFMYWAKRINLITFLV